MSEFARAFALMDRIDAQTAERLEPTPYGPVLVHRRLNRVHDLNFLRADRPGGASADLLAGEAERVQGEAGIGHRRVNLRGRAAGGERERRFLELGWERQRFVVMVNRRVSAQQAAASVREVDEPTVRPLFAEVIRQEPHGRDEALVQQILEHRRLIQRSVSTRLFAALADGRLVSHCELYSEDGVGQVENVATLPAFRGRGLARALVERAVVASRADGNTLTFLVADADDWPYRLYQRLGFEIVGRYARYLKKL